MFTQNSKFSGRKPLIKSRLGSTLIIPFVLQITAVVGLVGYLSFKNGQKAVTDLAIQLNNEVAARVSQTLQTYVSIPSQINQTNRQAIELGELNLQNYQQLEKHFWHQVQQFSSVTAVLLGTETQEFTGVERVAKNELNIDISRPETNYSHVSYGSDQDGNRTKFLGVNKPNYDPRKRPWYQAPAEAKRSVWSPIYTYVDSETLAITNGLPFYDQNGNLLGVTATDFSLSQISEFLQSLKVGKTGQVFILERSGMLVATSTDEKPSRTNTEGKAERFLATDSTNLTTQVTAQYLIKKFENLQAIHDPQHLIFNLNNKPDFLKILPFQDGQGLDWLIVVVVPEADFMAEINANNRSTILLIIYALITAIVISILTARFITRPIVQLTQASKKIADGNLDQRVNTTDLIEIEEINTLEYSFNSMAQQLQESFETLEDKVKERTLELAQANQEISSLNQKLKQENLRMSAELDVARQIQQMILPKPEELEGIEGLDICGYMEPADEVGGDYYDVLNIDGIVTIGIGDVTGHGLESGLLMLMTQTAVRTLKEVREQDSTRFLDTLNRTIYKNVQRMNSERNLTLAILNYSEGNLSVSGQHEETIIIRKGGRIERIDTMDLGLPIGIDDEIIDFISRTTLELEPGDGVVVYTDGITEAKDMNKKQYGIEQLCEIIHQNWYLSAEGLKDAVITDLRHHIGKQKVFDDITLLVIKRHNN
ncbi:Protein serine/threonine phosphatase with Cache sensor [Planktothrix serta PCC 8927]|uniref:Protein serine/threonine phosphatase with Cache sensor n=1 Tax=Planktothrix serta PCC 8927 TaxID=671068 RepID=A0A7Z9BLS2_9CYAN|nr:SpoIIE family protein phosphatase [Planktothrix serta]VXD17068.1 Protein serine/threonine phosphatase with Cache sensor [Planktothrix serta PCC 8927]